MFVSSLIVLPDASGRSMSIVSLMSADGGSSLTSIVNLPDSIFFTSSKSWIIRFMRSAARRTISTCRRS